MITGISVEEQRVIRKLVSDYQSAILPRNREIQKLMGNRIWLIDGAIGVGKTTLIEALWFCLASIGLEVVKFSETIHDVELKEYYADPHLHGLSFQFKMGKLAMNRENMAMTEQENGATVLIDRSVFGNKVFGKQMKEFGYLDEDQLPFFEKQIQSPLLQNRSVSRVLLHVDTEDTIKGVEKRGRDAEKDLDAQYLKRNIELHKEEFENRQSMLTNWRHYLIDWQGEDRTLEHFFSTLEQQSKNLPSCNSNKFDK